MFIWHDKLFNAHLKNPLFTDVVVIERIYSTTIKVWKLYVFVGYSVKKIHDFCQF